MKNIREEVLFSEIPNGGVFIENTTPNRESKWASAPVIWVKAEPIQSGGELIPIARSFAPFSSSFVRPFKPDTLVILPHKEDLLVIRHICREALRWGLRQLANLSGVTLLSRPRSWRAMTSIHIKGKRNDGRGLDGPVDLVARTHNAQPENTTRSILGVDRLSVQGGKTVFTVHGSEFHVTKQVPEIDQLLKPEEPKREKIHSLVPST